MLRLGVRDELDWEGPCARSAERLGPRAIATAGALRSTSFGATGGSLESRFGFVFDAHGQGPLARALARSVRGAPVAVASQL